MSLQSLSRLTVKSSTNHSVESFAQPADSPILLRLSVTERCNFSCRYCMPPGGIQKVHYEKLPTPQQLTQLVGRLVEWRHVTKVKITGGEPLLRPGIVDLVRSIVDIDGIDEVSMTTNGSRLSDLAVDLRQAGLDRVNISLDTVNSDRFEDLTGEHLANTLQGIEAAITAGLKPIKLNAVLRASTWRDDIPDLLDYASRMNLELRFIELMHTGSAAQWAANEYVAADQIIHWLSDRAEISDLYRSPGSPARRMRVRWKQSELTVGWITPQSHPFCDDCNRLRLDSQGRLRRCLMDQSSLPLISLVESLDAESAREAVSAYINKKKPPVEMSIDQPMVAVGG